MNTVNKIIALIDGSEYSQSVCEHAAWIALRTQASIDVIHVLGRREVSSEPANLSGSIGLGARTSLLAELAELDVYKAKLLKKRGRAILEDAKTRIHTAGVESVSTKLRYGEIAETVLAFQDTADIIVIGKRGEAADFDSLHLGSNLERVARTTNTPVLVSARAFRPVKRFLIAFDGGISVMKGIEHIANNAVFNDLECHLLSIGTPSPEIAQKITTATEQLTTAGYRVTSETRNGQSDIEIAKAVEANEVDLLIMGAYGHSRIRQLIIGSTTTEMIRSCKIPILLFR